MSLAATTTGFLTAGLNVSFSSTAQAQSVLTPAAALDELIAGNKRFTSDRLTHHRARPQDPETTYRGKAGAVRRRSVVCRFTHSIELVFDRAFGHIFVTRLAGNVVTPEIIGSLEYGAAVLGTKVILVLGHSNCGAVKATIQGKEVPGQISSLFPAFQPAVDQAGSNLEAATKANAKIQASLLRQSIHGDFRHGEGGHLACIVRLLRSRVGGGDDPGIVPIPTIDV